jgi:hypothetical protein
MDPVFQMRNLRARPSGILCQAHRTSDFRLEAPRSTFNVLYQEIGFSFPGRIEGASAQYEVEVVPCRDKLEQKQKQKFETRPRHMLKKKTQLPRSAAVLWLLWLLQTRFYRLNYDLAPD